MLRQLMMVLVQLIWSAKPDTENNDWRLVQLGDPMGRMLRSAWPGTDEVNILDKALNDVYRLKRHAMIYLVQLV
jgi:hypothetical protein